VRRLLDINTLIALCDPNHVHHERVSTWFEDIARRAWASCPITENGFIRILSNPGYPGLSGSVSVAVQLLQELRRHKGHEFWPDDYSIVAGSVNLSDEARSKNVTNLYLLGLAARKKSKLATLDARIPAHLVSGGREAYEVVSLL
jgi:toxin-antitoxin system PIN domain toxin